MFVCVSMNHLGLIGKIEDLIDHPLPVVNCPKCSSFWGTLVYMLFHTDIIGAVATAFLIAYLAIWTELVMCVTDYYYKRIYEKIISDSAADTPAASTHGGDADNAVP